MFFKNTLTLFAVAMMAIGTTGFAQDSITPLIGLVTGDDENCGKDAAKKAGCDPRDNSWLHPKLEAAKNSVKVGFGVRTSFRGNESEGVDSAGTFGGRVRDFQLDNARIFLSGNMGEKISAYLHTDINNAQGFGGDDGLGDGVRILDAAIDYQITDDVTVKMGRFLPPTDRSNLSGPFFINNYTFPWVQFTNGYYDVFQGRDDGVAFYGERGEDVQLKWSLALMEGYDNAPGDDNLWMVGRVVMNFLDREEGYFNSSTYYGEKDIAALGFTFSNQDDAHGAGLDYTAWSFDALLETTLDSGGVATIEAAYYDRDHDNAVGGGVNAGQQGEGYFILGSYLMADSISIGDIEGRLQPSIRFQSTDGDIRVGGNMDRSVDYSLNYIIHGHSARVSLVFQDINYVGGFDDQNLILGGQIRF
ncbi:MAG: hypothetical protein CMJ68_06200 [Planctomycetaceae bacterium]|nr:hypothetical protein [Planctomycetaceae bacterium]|tara:strand:- start:7 stop:1257 length:1251 start_codon:yes stop_codon:yes gene_type:complete